MFAGAAFTDSADIKATDAVNMLTALGVIDGYEDGSFRPNGTVTRAQMAKMIFVVWNGGKSDAKAYQTMDSAFADTKDHWARGYINFCASNNIIAGKSATTFAPDATVTGQEAAKMLLTVIGYDQTKAGLTGPKWKQNTMSYAGMCGLFDDVDASVENALPRQYAAQMIYNALDANRVKWSTDSNSFDEIQTWGNGSFVKETVGEKYMDLLKVTGVLTSVKEDSKGLFNAEIVVDNTAENTGSATTFSKISEDYSDMLGQSVKVLYKKGKTDNVFGVYATDDNEIAVAATAGEVSDYKPNDKTIKVAGTKYNLSGAELVYTVKSGDVKNASGDFASNATNGSVELTGGSKIADALIGTKNTDFKVNTASTVYFVSNDGDNKIDAIIVAPAQVVKVNYVGSSTITLANGVGSIDEDDYAAEEGIKKGDFVVYTADEDSTYYVDSLTKVETVTGTVEAVKNTTEAKIDGTYYKRGSECNDTPKANDKVTAAIYGNRYYDLDATSEASADDILFVKEAGKIQSGVASGVEATVLFADGTEKTIVVDSLYAPTNDENDIDATDAVVLTKNNSASYKAGTDGKVYVGGLYTYDIDGSKYDLTPFQQEDNDAGYDDVVDVTDGNTYVENNDSQRMLGNRIDDTAIIFVAKKYTTDKTTGMDAKVITGKELKTWDGTYGTLGQALCNTKNGVKTVMVGTIMAADSSYGSESGNYGIITSDPETVKINGSSYQSFKLWNGTEDVVTIAKSSEMNNAKKGNVVKFDTDGSENDTPKIKSLAVIGNKAAALGIEANGSTKYDVTLTSTGNKADQYTYTVDSDTTVLFISENDGVSGDLTGDYNSYETAIDGIYVKNVIYVAKADDTLDLLVIDVRTKLKAEGTLDKAVAGDISVVIDGNKSKITGIADTETAVQAKLKNVLAVKKLDAKLYTVVGNDGTAYTFTLE